jgi:hypothetical protein
VAGRRAGEIAPTTAFAPAILASDHSVYMSEDPTARRARYFLYLLGGVFVALGFSLEMVPELAAVAPSLAGRVCAGIGAAILSVGRFGSDRLVLRCETLLTGWF